MLDNKALDSMIFGQGMGNPVIKQIKNKHIKEHEVVTNYIGCPNIKAFKLKEAYGIQDIKDCLDCMIYSDNVFCGFKSDMPCTKCEKKLIMNRIYR